MNIGISFFLEIVKPPQPLKNIILEGFPDRSEFTPGAL